MTTIEKIKAEVERLIAMNKTRNGFPAGTMCAVRIEAYENLLSFLSTLEEETPNDLEEAAGLYLDNHKPLTRYNWGDLMDAFKAGAKWQKDQDMDEWIKDRDGCFWDGVNEGKKAMKEKMLKEAVEAMVTTNLANRPVVYIDELQGFKYGDKVRIIVLKKEDEK